MRLAMRFWGTEKIASRKRAVTVRMDCNIRGRIIFPTSSFELVARGVSSLCVNNSRAGLGSKMPNPVSRVLQTRQFRGGLLAIRKLDLEHRSLHTSRTFGPLLRSRTQSNDFSGLPAGCRHTRFIVGCGQSFRASRMDPSKRDPTEDSRSRQRPSMT